MPRLSVDSIVNVSVNLAPAASTIDAGNNVGLILGTTNVITAVNRMKKYTGLAQMLQDGFTASSPEYVAADLYFKQNPAPKALYVGRIDTTANPAETPAAAFAACCDLGGDFYGVYSCGASVAEQVALATAVETYGKAIMFFESANADCLVASPDTPDIFSTLKSANRERAIGIYNAADYAGAALMGLAMGLETGQDNSAFDLFFKTLIGITPTAAISESQLTILKNKNGNAYVTRGQDTTMLEPGNCVDGTPYDETMYIDLTIKTVQAYILNAMAGNTTPKIMQTDDGLGIILSAAMSACERMRRLGFVAAGKWTSNDFGYIKEGDVLESGYAVFSDSIEDLTTEDREARKLPPIYIALKLSGSGRSVSVGINVNR